MAEPPDRARASEFGPLVPRPIDGPPPRALQLADSIEVARRGQLLHVDERGHVRSPARYRLLTALAYGYSGALATLGATFCAGVFGPAWGAAAAVLFGGSFVVGVHRRRQTTRAAGLIAEGRLVEAEATCRELLSSRLSSRELRAGAHQNLAVVASRRGDFEEALVHTRAAIRLRHSALRRSVQLELLAYLELMLLVNLGRVGEARARLTARGAIPDGDYLRMLHWTADLAVQFAEGRVALDEEDLWERGRAALRITGAANLLALCAWAYARQGEAEMAVHLLAEAADRADVETAIGFPRLWAWVEERRAAG